MAPVAITSAVPSPKSPSMPIAAVKGCTNMVEIPRRPSPWHDLAHSLSTTSLPSPRRASSSHTPSSLASTAYSSPPASPSSLAFREWEVRLTDSSNLYSRHTLFSSTPSPTLVPKLEPERDKEGHIEYKLKLIDPTQERFERLVSQMMWRLKQGGNEAIYELGLADDGTVIGLTRVEMDASLRTLELMASEVGATVIVLKEIVLTGPQYARPPIAHFSSLEFGSAPDQAPATKSKRSRRRRYARADGRRRDQIRQDWLAGGRVPEPNKEKQIVFNPADLVSDSDEDDDVPTFHLDLEEKPAGPIETVKYHYAQRPRSAAKLRKSMERSEKRRMDLLRGDGMSPPPNVQLSIADLSVDSTPTSSSSVTPTGDARPTPVQQLQHAAHQPSRPSSLRLVTPVVDTSNESEDEHFLHDLLHVPLDSLSLSFADVRTVSASSSSSSLTEFAEAKDQDDEEQSEPVPLGDERICVEALVVRKLGLNEDEDGWSYGGEEDGWGLGGEYVSWDPKQQLGGATDVGDEAGDEDRSEDDAVDDDDPWGFG